MSSRRRRHFRFVGGEHDGQRTPVWVWQGGRAEWRLPIAQKGIVPFDAGDPLTPDWGPDFEVVAFKLIPMCADLEVFAWVREGISKTDARLRIVEELLDRDEP